MREKKTWTIDDGFNIRLWEGKLNLKSDFSLRILSYDIELRIFRLYEIHDPTIIHDASPHER